MNILIKNADVYAPESIGIKDVLILNTKIELISEVIEEENLRKVGLELQVIDARDKILAPGFIDQHVHITGGGGENGFASRTPEIEIDNIIKNGFTTIVGLLGTDGVTRTMEDLLAKANSLQEKGITTYVYSGSYRIPITSLCGSPMRDIILIDKIIGVGEVAISDNRSSNPNFHQFAQLCQDARVGGLLSGKAGVIHIHVGDGKDCLKFLKRIIEETDTPLKQIVPTHVNRNKVLFDDAIEFAKLGGYVDITSSIFPTEGDTTPIKPSKAVLDMLYSGVSPDNITISSDGQGSSPIFDKNGNMIRMDICSLENSMKEFRALIFEEKLPLSIALKFFTINPASVLKLENKKANIKNGFDADIILFDKNKLEVDTLISLGRVMMKNKRIL